MYGAYPVLDSLLMYGPMLPPCSVLHWHITAILNCCPWWCAGMHSGYTAPATGEKKAPTITGQSTVAKLPKAQVSILLLVEIVMYL